MRPVGDRHHEEPQREGLVTHDGVTAQLVGQPDQRGPAHQSGQGDELP